MSHFVPVRPSFQTTKHIRPLKGRYGNSMILEEQQSCPSSRPSLSHFVPVPPKQKNRCWWLGRTETTSLETGCPSLSQSNFLKFWCCPSFVPVFPRRNKYRHSLDWTKTTCFSVCPSSCPSLSQFLCCRWAIHPT